MRLDGVAERDGWWCWLCGGAIDPHAPRDSAVRGTVDHLVPRSRGGGNELANLRLAHKRCNVRRGSHLPELLWPREWPMLMTVHLWTAMARLAPRPGTAEVVALAPLSDLADEAATWVVERAEEFVPGGWESWCAADPAGPVAVWLRRPAGAAPGSTGRPKIVVPG
ncbi:MAG: HNH endonuclease [Actinobacteria bacterium]|nr:HNH endonuclease [Actinomycetota bacterium]